MPINKCRSNIAIQCTNNHWYFHKTKRIKVRQYQYHIHPCTNSPIEKHLFITTTHPTLFVAEHINDNFLWQVIFMFVMKHMLNLKIENGTYCLCYISMDSKKYCSKLNILIFNLLERMKHMITSGKANTPHFWKGTIVMKSFDYQILVQQHHQHTHPTNHHVNIFK